MNESNLYSVKEIFSFWSKFERFYNFFKKTFWTVLVLNLLFWLIYIPIKDENPTTILGIIILISSFLASFVCLEKKNLSFIIFLCGLILFIYSYFMIIPMQKNIWCSFITNKEGKLLNYGNYQFFHIPIYNKHFDYKVKQQREINNLKDVSKIIISFNFDFKELFKDKNRLGLYYPISRKYFDGIVDKKTALIKNYIEKNGNPEKFTDLKDLNDPWLKITSLEINFDTIKIE